MKQALLPLLVSAVLAQGAFSQKKLTEGTIRFKMDYDLPAEMKAHASMFPSGMTAVFKGTKVRMEQNGGMMGMTSIYDSKSKASVILMNTMGKKLAMELQEEEQPASDFGVEYVSEPRTVAGYKCSKAVVSDKKSGQSFTVYYTEELQIPAGGDYTPFKNAVKGVPLEYAGIIEGMSMKFYATEINFEKVDASVFEIPADYQKVTKEEWQKMMGGSVPGF